MSAMNAALKKNLRVCLITWVGLLLVWKLGALDALSIRRREGVRHRNGAYYVHFVVIITTL